jgi:transcriptional regulator with GAF, ATPase, and Fis domain
MAREGEGSESAGLRGWARALAEWFRALGRGLLHDPITRRRGGILLAAFFVCGYAAWVLGYVLATPEIGVRCAFAPVVNHFYPEFLYPEKQRTTLREGDHIVQVADQPVGNWSQLLRKMLLLEREEPAFLPGLSAADVIAGRVPEDKHFLLLDNQPIVRVVYERPEEPRQHTVWCRLGRSPLETLVPSILWFFLKVGLFVVGAIVFWKRPEDRPAAQFFWLCIVSFGAFMGGYHWSRIVTQPVLIVVFMVCAILLPAVTLHFYLVFPRPKAFFERHRRGVLLAIYGLPAFFLLLLLQGYLLVRGMDASPGITSGSVSILEVMLLEIYVYFGIATLWYLLSLLSLVYSFRTAATPMERNQVKWILLGVAAATVPIGYSLYLAFWEKGKFGGGAATWPMFAASACVTLAYTVSITRYRLMQLDQLLSSGMVYFLISTLSGLLYYGVVFAGLLVVGSQVGEGPPLHQVLIVASAALLLMGALDLARGRLRHALDRHFRREKYQLDRTLQRMSQAIEQLVDPPTLARRLLHTTAELLSAPTGAVYLRKGDPPLYCLTDAIGPPPPLTELSSGCPLVEALRGAGTLGQVLPLNGVKPGFGSPGAPALRQLQFLQGGVAQALTHEGQLLGLLLLGPRPANAYTPEDMHLLAAFAQMTVLALVSAEGHRTIETLNRDLKGKVEKIAEQQRRILALQSQLKREDRKTPAEETVAPVPPSPPPEKQEEGTEETLVGSSPQIQHLIHKIKRVAASASAVLLRGESGTGKGVVAKALHENSPRADKPFVKVHCAALSAGLLESELFGHVKGAFTSAIRDKVGRFESAHGGTLFFDEIGDISLEVQTKLLRVLEEMTFERVGSSEPVQVDVRIIAATHRDLEGMIAEGRFREDLFFRLNVLPITVPPLRDRTEDVPELVQHFLRMYNQRAAKQVTTVEDDALVVLKAYRWAGNVRQLENVIERAVIFAEGATITVADLPDEVSSAVETEGIEEAAGNGWTGGSASGLSLPELASVIQAERQDRERREREQLVRALAAAGGNKAVAARALGMARSTLVSRLKKFGLS